MSASQAHPQHDPHTQKADPRPALPDGEAPSPVAPESGASVIGALGGEIRQSAILEWQRTQGNAFVQRMLAPLVQREGPAPTPAPAPGATPVPAPGTDKPPLGTLKGSYKHFGPNFDADYTPSGPAPKVDNLNITHNVFIDFKPFDEVKREEPYKNMRFTREQKADFNWSKAEETKFAADFISSVHDGWSGKHKLSLKEPSFTEYAAAVQVNVVQVKDAGKAHTKIKAVKVPKTLPRYRSFVNRGEHSAVLDIQDPSAPEKHQVRDRKLVRQVKSFENDSADPAPMEGQLSGLAGEMKKMTATGGTAAKPFGEDYDISFIGRSNRPGTKGHNEKLGDKRAEAIKARINALMGWTGVGVAASLGAENADDSEAFRRVDVIVFAKDRHEVSQNVAAHEFGHMIGFDDEYTEEKPDPGVAAKFLGDQSDHYDKIKELMGEEAANETLRQNSANIMSTGGEVKRGHYVFFLEAMNKMTGHSWSVG